MQRAEECSRLVLGSTVSQLKNDRTERSNHLVMARCDTIQSAENIHAIYDELAPEYKPVLVHSEGGDTRERIAVVTFAPPHQPEANLRQTWTSGS